MKLLFPRLQRIAIFLLPAFLASCVANAALKDGDIVFQRSNSKQAQAVALATHSDYTHIGIVFYDGGIPFVYEAIQPVCKTPLNAWIARGEGGRYVAKRLKDSTGLDVAQVHSEVNKMMGKNYDWLFEWTDERIYCSELVWKAYFNAAGIELGSLRTLGDLDLSNPLVCQMMKERYGKNIPLKMSVIAPSDIFASTLLVSVDQEQK